MPTRPRPPIRHRAYWSTFLLSMGLLAWVIRWHVRGLDFEVRREGLANAAVIGCRNVLVDHVDIETGLRGYLVTGHREFLRPYHEGLGRCEADLAVLREAVEHSPVEHAYFESVAGSSKAVLKEFSNQVDVLESGGVEAARRRFLDFPTKPGMDKIRRVLLEIQASEDRRLAENMGRLERSLSTTLALINLFIVVVCGLLVAMFSGLFIQPTRQPAPRSGDG